MEEPPPRFAVDHAALTAPSQEMRADVSIRGQPMGNGCRGVRGWIPSRLAAPRLTSTLGTDRVAYPVSSSPGLSRGPPLHQAHVTARLQVAVSGSRRHRDSLSAGVPCRRSSHGQRIPGGALPVATARGCAYLGSWGQIARVGSASGNDTWREYGHFSNAPANVRHVAGLVPRVAFPDQ